MNSKIILLICLFCIPSILLSKEYKELRMVYVETFDSSKGWRIVLKDNHKAIASKVLSSVQRRDRKKRLREGEHVTYLRFYLIEEKQGQNWIPLVTFSGKGVLSEPHYFHKDQEQEMCKALSNLIQQAREDDLRTSKEHK